MFSTPEHRTVVTMLAEGKPVWFIAAVTKSHSHYVYSVGAEYGYPDRAALKRSLRALSGRDLRLAA